jgi:transposase
MTCILGNDIWDRLKPFVPGFEGTRGPRTDARLFLSALMWVANKPEGWEGLPSRYGSIASVRRRYRRWRDNGTLDRVCESLELEPDLQSLLRDLFAKLKERLSCTRFC